MEKNIHFKLLYESSECIPILADLWYQEIGQYWVKGSSREAVSQKLQLHLNQEKLPIAIVAFAGCQPVGMVCLRKNDGIWEELTPWLGSLVVHPNFRRQKIGNILIDKVKDMAKALGYKILYLLAFDPTISQWYERLGWSYIGFDELLNHRVTVMRIQL